MRFLENKSLWFENGTSKVRTCNLYCLNTIFKEGHSYQLSQHQLFLELGDQDITYLESFEYM